MFFQKVYSITTTNHQGDKTDSVPIESRGCWKPDGDADQTNGPCRARGKQKCEYPRRRPALLGKRCCCILKRGCLNTNSGGTADDSSVLCVNFDRTDVFL